MNRPRVFRDPIHGLVNVHPADEFVLDLIDAPEFQRLRRVRQLGVSHLTYPGAEHTRFNHSLGVFQVAQRMLDGLLRLYGEESSMGRRILEHRGHVKAAALLHDTGHAAFSHLMERAFEETADHEKRSQDLIAGTHSSIPGILKKHGLNAATVADIVGKRFTHRFLQDIVSSSLDADRMDYLLRDAHFTGVRYGVYDLEWLMNCVCLGTLKPEKGEGEEVLRLCLDRKRGLYSAEQLMLARQHMSVQVYFHKSTRRWEAHLLCLFREAARLAKMEKLPKGTLPAVAAYFAQEGGVDDAVFLEVDEPAVIGCLGLWAGCTQVQHRLLARLAKAYLRREKIFEMIELAPPTVAKAAEWRKLLEEQPAKWRNHWELDDISFSGYKMSKAAEKEEDPEGYFQKIAANAVLLSDGGAEDAAVPVQEVSPIFRTLGAEQPRFLRLYFLPEMAQVVDKIDKKLQNH